MKMRTKPGNDPRGKLTHDMMALVLATYPGVRTNATVCVNAIAATADVLANLLGYATVEMKQHEVDRFRRMIHERISLVTAAAANEIERVFGPSDG